MAKHAPLSQKARGQEGPSLGKPRLNSAALADTHLGVHKQPCL